MASNSTSAIDDERRDAIRAFLHAHADEFVAQLSDWLRIPSVWADPERADDVKRSAEWFADAARAAGFPIVEIWPAADGAPTVFAHWPSDDASAPTVVVYGHHDVQPVDPVGSWRFPARTAIGCSVAAVLTTKARSFFTCSVCARVSQRVAEPARRST
jgi:hypothetical protein